MPKKPSCKYVSCKIEWTDVYGKKRTSNLDNIAERIDHLAKRLKLSTPDVIILSVYNQFLNAEGK